MVQPEFAHDHKADEPTEQLREEREGAPAAEFPPGCGGRRGREDFQIEHEQRDHDGKDAVAERLDPPQAHFAAGKTVPGNAYRHALKGGMAKMTSEF